MRRRRLPYCEGDWFAVPLRDTGYATGLVARADRRGGLLGYFFGPRRESPASLEDLQMLTPSDAILVGQFGDLGLLRGAWPIIGSAGAWDRAAWPMPLFARTDVVPGARCVWWSTPRTIPFIRCGPGPVIGPRAYSTPGTP